MPNNIFQENNPVDILNSYLISHKFYLSKGSNFPVEYSRGSWYGDFCSKHIGLLIKFSNIPSYTNKCRVTIEAKWMILFDTGDLYKILHSIKSDLEQASTPIWKEGTVDTNKDYIVLKEAESLKTLAYVSSNTGEIHVSFNTDTHSKTSIDEAKKQLDFYFGEKQEKNPWEYAIYHCSSSANIYSPIRWVYIENKD
ncbi:MAG: hypothetical protein KAT04_08200 [Methylococcales bacterium]|nr:hypothetical protein [Methylococcales bacterium]